MKILIMSYTDKKDWYKNKIGKTFEVLEILSNSYKTKEGYIKKKDCVEV